MSVYLVNLSPFQLSKIQTKIREGKNFTLSLKNNYLNQLPELIKNDVLILSAIQEKHCAPSLSSYIRISEDEERKGIFKSYRIVKVDSLKSMKFINSIQITPAVAEILVNGTYTGIREDSFVKSIFPAIKDDPEEFFSSLIGVPGYVELSGIHDLKYTEIFSDFNSGYIKLTDTVNNELSSEDKTILKRLENYSENFGSSNSLKMTYKLKLCKLGIYSHGDESDEFLQRIYKLCKKHSYTGYVLKDICEKISSQDIGDEPELELYDDEKIEEFCELDPLETLIEIQKLGYPLIDTYQIQANHFFCSKANEYDGVKTIVTENYLYQLYTTLPEENYFEPFCTENKGITTDFTREFEISFCKTELKQLIETVNKVIEESFNIYIHKNKNSKEAIICVLSFFERDCYEIPQYMEESRYVNSYKYIIGFWIPKRVRGLKSILVPKFKKLQAENRECRNEYRIDSNSAVRKYIFYNGNLDCLIDSDEEVEALNLVEDL